jgi:hypothetical protein
MSSGGRVNWILDHIPGYGGYRDKESRRDSDHAIRESLATEYGQLADRLGRLATQLADERKLAAIGMVDKPLKRLRSFIDRVRTASYGYSPLFANDKVDESALDQLAAFDRSLADQQAIVANQISQIEAADPGSDAFKAACSSLTTTIEELHDRFDKRNDVLQTGKSLPEKDVLDLLAPSKPAGTPVAWVLTPGDALSYDGENYAVVGRVSVEAADANFRAFQLRGGDENQWLESSGESGGSLFWMVRVNVDGIAGQPAVTVSGSAYNLDSSSNGKGEVIGQQGTAEQPVRFHRYHPATGDTVLHIYDWGNNTLALEGRQIDVRDVQLYTRTK